MASLDYTDINQQMNDGNGRSGDVDLPVGGSGGGCDHKNDPSLSSMILAVQDGCLYCLENVIKSGCDVTQRDAQEWTALTYAIAENQWECFRMLSRAYCYKDLVVDKKTSHFISALEERSFEKIVKLVRKKKLTQNMSVQAKAPFLFLAMGHGCPPDALSAILTERNIVDVRYHSGMTPLMFSLVTGQLTTVQKVLSLNPNLYIRDDLGRDAMCYAVLKGVPACLELLLEWSTKHEANQCSLDKAMKIAVTKEQGECLLVLLNWNQKNATRSENKNSDSIASELLCLAANVGSLKCMDILIDFGADASWANNVQETALMYAVIEDRVECFDRLLLLPGVDVNAVDLEGNSALMHAAQFGRPRFVTKLLDVGADVNLVNNYSMTTISMATCHNDTSLLELILTVLEGSNKVRLRCHATAFQLAAKFCNLEAVLLLMEHDIFQWHWVEDASPPQLVAAAAVKSGTRPGQFIMWDDQTMTLLKLAFYYDDHSTARFLMANLYLTEYDVTVLTRDAGFIAKIRRRASPQSIALLDQLICERTPWSLQALSFLSISMAINGPSKDDFTPSRRFDMIQRLPIPTQFIDKLMFKSPLSRLCVDQWCKIGTHSRGSSLSDVNLVSHNAPLWKGCSLPESCGSGTGTSCSNKDGAYFRRHFQLLQYRGAFRFTVESTNNVN